MKKGINDTLEMIGWMAVFAAIFAAFAFCTPNQMSGEFDLATEEVAK